jgi:hypothetical protein
VIPFRADQGSQVNATPFVALNVAGVQNVGLALRYHTW